MKILYIKAQWLGDMIGWIPFLVEHKNNWDEVYQTFYDMRHLNKAVEKLTKVQKEKYKKLPMYGGWHYVLEMLKTQWLVKDIIIIPFGRRKMFLFIIKYFRSFDEAVIPIKTSAGIFIGHMLAKKTRYIFEDVNDISKFRILADGERGETCPALHTYYTQANITEESIDLPDNFVTVFPSIYERSIEIKDWIVIMNHVKSLWYNIVVIGWDREQRFTDKLKEANYYDQIIDYVSKTSIRQVAYLAKRAQFCISCNGGQMRTATLVNPKAINIHTVSSFVVEPPVDNITSFNIREYHYNECKPCESAWSTIGECGITWCVFYKTGREWECRKFNTAAKIILIIKKILQKERSDLNS